MISGVEFFRKESEAISVQCSKGVLYASKLIVLICFWIFMPPTSEKLRRLIDLGLSVRAPVRAWVALCIGSRMVKDRILKFDMWNHHHHHHHIHFRALFSSTEGWAF